MNPLTQVRATLIRQWPIVLVGLIFVAAFVLVGANFWRRGALLIGIGTAVAAALRLVLSEDRAGLLVLRRTGVLKKREIDAGRNADVNMDIGQTVEVESWSETGLARVWYRGAHWQAELAAGQPRQPGPHVIAELRGTRLVLVPRETAERA